MRMEYVVVSYPTARDVRIDGQIAGKTNDTLRVERGHHTFDLLCSDLNGVHVARAVAASSNFPIAFTPMIVNNYAGTCGYKEPTWMEEASKDLLDNPPRFNRARIARSYLNKDERTYIPLTDMSRKFGDDSLIYSWMRMFPFQISVSCFVSWDSKSV